MYIYIEYVSMSSGCFTVTCPPLLYDVTIYVYTIIWPRQDLEELYDAGTLRSLGVSNFDVSELTRFNQKVRLKPHVVQNKFSVYHRGWAPVVRHATRPSTVYFDVDVASL